MFVIFGTGEEGMDTPSRVAPGTNPKLFFLKGKVTKRKRVKALYFRKYESQPESSFCSKKSSLSIKSSRVLARNRTLKLGN